MEIAMIGEEHAVDEVDDVIPTSTATCTITTY